jgi:hypothetical protein
MTLEQYVAIWREAHGLYAGAVAAYLANENPTTEAAAGAAQTALQTAWANIGWFIGTQDANGNPK